MPFSKKTRLYSQASANFNNLGIEKISIFTYASNHNYENESLSIFNWVEAPYFLKRKCFTMIIPEDIIHEGIAKISITSNQLSVQIHIHELGLFNTDMTGASIKTSYRWHSLRKEQKKHFKSTSYFLLTCFNAHNCFGAIGTT